MSVDWNKEWKATDSQVRESRLSEFRELQSTQAEEEARAASQALNETSRPQQQLSENIQKNPQTEQLEANRSDTLTEGEPAAEQAQVAQAKKEQQVAELQDRARKFGALLSSAREVARSDNVATAAAVDPKAPAEDSGLVRKSGDEAGRSPTPAHKAGNKTETRPQVSDPRRADPKSQEGRLRKEKTDQRGEESTRASHEDRDGETVEQRRPEQTLKGLLDGRTLPRPSTPAPREIPSSNLNRAEAQPKEKVGRAEPSTSKKTSKAGKAGKAEGKAASSVSKSGGGERSEALAAQAEGGGLSGGEGSDSPPSLEKLPPSREKIAAVVPAAVQAYSEPDANPDLKCRSMGLAGIEQVIWKGKKLIEAMDTAIISIARSETLDVSMLVQKGLSESVDAARKAMMLEFYRDRRYS